MSSIRVLLRLIALLVIVDFCVTTWLTGDDRTALIPPLVGSIITSIACWQDASGPSRRKVIFALSIFTSVSIAMGLGLELHQPSWYQSSSLALLLILSAAVTVRSWHASKRRRVRLAGYLTDQRMFLQAK